MIREKNIESLTGALKDIGEASYGELAVLASVSAETARRAMLEIEENDPHVSSFQKSGCKVYKWSDNVGNEAKNSEGYNDLTPYIAMLNDEVSDSRFTEGAVYAKENGFTGTVGEPGFILVLKGYKGSVTYLDVYETSFRYYDETHAVTFQNGEKTYYVDPRRVKTTGEKSIGSCQFYLLMEDFVTIKRSIVASLRLDFGATKEFTQSDAIRLLKNNGWLKEHDDAVCREVMKMPDAKAVKDPDIEMVTRERDIWKEAFFAVCGK